MLNNWIFFTEHDVIQIECSTRTKYWNNYVSRMQKWRVESIPDFRQKLFLATLSSIITPTKYYIKIVLKNLKNDFDIVFCWVFDAICTLWASWKILESRYRYMLTDLFWSKGNDHDWEDTWFQHGILYTNNYFSGPVICPSRSCNLTIIDFLLCVLLLFYSRDSRTLNNL